MPAEQVRLIQLDRFGHRITFTGVAVASTIAGSAVLFFVPPPRRRRSFFFRIAGNSAGAGTAFISAPKRVTT